MKKIGTLAGIKIYQMQKKVSEDLDKFLKETIGYYKYLPNFLFKRIIKISTTKGYKLNESTYYIYAFNKKIGQKTFKF